MPLQNLNIFAQLITNSTHLKFQGRFHWTMNGVGLEFNHLFGFGVLDAGAMTALAANWRSVPPRYHCEAGSVNTHT